MRNSNSRSRTAAPCCRGLLTLALAALVSLSISPTLGQQVPNAISYQGKLTNALGQPVSDGAYPVQFKLYIVSTAGVAFWTSAVQNVTTSGGVFTTQLTPLAASDLAGKTDVWLEIWVGSPLAALSPRTKFTSVPYALISGDSWSLLGNAGTTPGTNFIGTTDNQPLEFRVNDICGFRLVPTSGTPNIIGGYSGNTVTAGASGATISGGGMIGLPNSVTSQYGTVGGGLRNTAGLYATVGGGVYNTASGQYATVGGGDYNTASGSYGTVGGGLFNTALGSYSFAAGLRAKANHDGAFVWADNTDVNFTSTAANQFLIRASGGVGIGTATPGFPLTFTNALGDKISLWGQSGAHYGFGIQNSLLQIHTDGSQSDIAFGYGSSGAMTETMRIKGTGNVGIGLFSPSYKLHVNGVVAGVGAYVNLSDLRYKTNIQTISHALDKVMKLRGINFDWKKSEYPELAFGDGPQVGFVAQEIAQVLPEVVSKDDKGIYSVAYGSVAPLLVEAMKEQNTRLDRLESENGSLRRQIDDLKKIVRCFGI